MDFKFTPHAQDEMRNRGIPLEVVLAVLENPEQIVPALKERQTYQGRVNINGKLYLVRIVVEADGTVVTVYRTSKIEKYWSGE